MTLQEILAALESRQRVCWRDSSQFVFHKPNELTCTILLYVQTSWGHELLYCGWGEHAKLTLNPDEFYIDTGGFT